MTHDINKLLAILKEISTSTETVKRDNGDEILTFKSVVTEKYNPFFMAVCDPWDDYSYKWTEDSIDDLIAYLDGCTNEDHADDLDDFVRDSTDDISEDIDARVDVYNNRLLKWLGHRLSNADYVEDAIKEGLVDMKDFNLFKAIMAGQYRAIEEHHHKVIAAVIEHLLPLCEVSEEVIA